MSVSLFFDMLAALALTALLAESYGIVRRRFVGAVWAPVVLGILFGIMAAVQMYNPLIPFEGVIIDLRNIPIALAGAFLGWRGLLPCLMIALLVRVDIGGVGVQAGVTGMVIAGLAGMIWARKTARYDRRNFAMLLLLALAMSAHLLGALALPRDMATWFFTAAAGPILAMNLLSVPLIGALMERENQRIADDNLRDAAITRDPVTGLLTPAAFFRDLSNAHAAEPFGTFAGFVEITPHPGSVGRVNDACHPRGKAFVDRHFLALHLDHGKLAGQDQTGRILIPLSELETANSNRLTHELRQALRTYVASLGTTMPFSLSVSEAHDPKLFLRIAGSLVVPDQPHWSDFPLGGECASLCSGDVSQVRRSRIFDPEKHESLFAKADFLIDRSQT